MLVQLCVDNIHFPTHRLRGLEHQCGSSEADENTVFKQNLERWSVSTPRSFAVLAKEKVAVCSKIGLHRTNFGMPRCGVMKITMGSYLFTVGTWRRGPAMDAGARPPSCRQWLVFYLSLCLREAAGETLDHYLELQHTCLRHFDFNIRGVQLWAASPSFEIQCNEKSNLTYIYSLYLFVIY